MDEHRPPAPDAVTLARFIEEAARTAGGMDALRRRLGVSKAALESMSVSDTPLVSDDAKTLLEVFGLSPRGTAGLPDQQD